MHFQSFSPGLSLMLDGTSPAKFSLDCKASNVVSTIDHIHHHDNARRNLLSCTRRCLKLHEGEEQKVCPIRDVMPLPLWSLGWPFFALISLLQLSPNITSETVIFLCTLNLILVLSPIWEAETWCKLSWVRRFFHSDQDWRQRAHWVSSSTYTGIGQDATLWELDYQSIQHKAVSSMFPDAKTLELNGCLDVPSRLFWKKHTLTPHTPRCRDCFRPLLVQDIFTLPLIGGTGHL